MTRPSAPPECLEPRLLSPPQAEDLLSPQVQETPAPSLKRRAELAVEAMVSDLLRHETLDRSRIDCALTQISDIIQAQVNAILHAPQFQDLERTWRGLSTLIDRVDFKENQQVVILNASKEDLIDDQFNSADPIDSGLYLHVYTREFGTHGGTPYALICGNYNFGPSPRDIKLLKGCAAIAAMAHAPFVANADPSFFGEQSHKSLPELQDLDAIFTGPVYSRWKAFRTSEDARYVGLCLPRFLLRQPYGENGCVVRRFRFEEQCEHEHEHYLWGPCSILFASRVADSFAKYRWCPNVVGVDSGGLVQGLEHYRYETMGDLQTRIPTEFQLSDSREYALSQLGFIGLMYRKRDQSACFLSANSVQSRSIDDMSPSEPQTSLERSIGAQLPYLFIVTRIAHYIKTLQRENLGTWTDRSRIEGELNDWMRQFVANVDSPSPAIRARRPLRQAQVQVLDDHDEPTGEHAFYRCHIRLRPHFKYMGADLNLSLLSTLPR